MDTQPTEDSQSRTSRHREDVCVRVNCEVSFSHKMTSPIAHTATIVNGRIDHGIGVTLETTYCQWDLPFHSHLLAVEACTVDHALLELVVGTWRSSINLGCDDNGATPLSTVTALFRMASLSSL